MRSVGAIIETRLEKRRRSQFRKEIHRLRETAAHLRCELYLVHLRAAELYEETGADTLGESPAFSHLVTVESNKIRVAARQILTANEF
jgi:hypothetical protein